MASVAVLDVSCKGCLHPSPVVLAFHELIRTPDIAGPSSWTSPVGPSGLVVREVGANH